MRTFWTGMLAAGFVATVGLSAQNAPPSGQAPGQRGAQPQTQTRAQASSDAKKVTVSGCIQSAPTGAASQGSSAKFVLAMKPTGARAEGGAVGTAGTATRYALEGEEKQISPHLNHQVEITGMVEGASASSQGPASNAGAKAQASAMPTLKVEMVKMVSATCS